MIYRKSVMMKKLNIQLILGSDMEIRDSKNKRL